MCFFFCAVILVIAKVEINISQNCIKPYFIVKNWTLCIREEAQMAEVGLCLKNENAIDRNC